MRLMRSAGDCRAHRSSLPSACAGHPLSCECARGVKSSGGHQSLPSWARWVAVGSISFIVVCTSLAAQSSGLERAEDSLRAGMVAEAKQIAQAALRANPRNPEAHLVMGEVRLHEANPGEAAKSFDFSLALDASLRARVAQAYLLAAKAMLQRRNLDLAVTYTRRAFGHDATVMAEAVEGVYNHAVEQLRVGEPYGEVVMTRLLEEFPDYSSDDEAWLFFTAQYFERQGKRTWAKQYYERCTGLHPNGEHGQRAATILAPKVLPLNSTLQQDCGWSGRLFITLKKLDLEYDSTAAVLSFVLNHERERNFAVEEDTQLEGSTGHTYPVDQQRYDKFLIGDDFSLRPGEELISKVYFPPLEPREHSLTLSLDVDHCEEFRFRDLLLAGQLEAGTSTTESTASVATPASGSSDGASYEVNVHHIHDFFIGTGTCEGRLIFAPRQITYVSGAHRFDLPCSKVFGVTKSQKSVTARVQGESSRVTIQTVRINGQTRNKKGKVVEKTWHFVAQERTPPAVIVSKATCRGGSN